MPIRQRIARHLGEAVSCPQPATSGSISSSSLPPVAPLPKKRAPFPSSLLSNKPGVNKNAVFKLRTELNGKAIGSKMIEEVPKPGSLDRARAQSEALNKNNNDKRKREAPDEVRPQSFYGGGGRAAEQDAGGSPPKKRKVAEAAKAVSNKRKRETLDEEVSPDASGNAAEQDAGERTETSATTKKRKLAGHSEPTAHSAAEPAGKAPLQSQAPAETTALPPPVKPASSTKARAKAKAKAPVKAPVQHRNNTKSSTAKPKMDAASFLSAPCRRSSRLTQTPLDQLSPEQKYLSYYDVTLTNEDIKALRTDWLTDINISFWEEWLEREILPKYPQARIVLLRPTMTMILTKERKMEQVKKALPEFRNVTHIFVPITDATSAQAEGGTHWSLLLVSTIDGVAFHYDSLGNANYKEGYEATYCLSKVLGIPLRFQNIEDCPQQENGNDCGVFVCILMRHLLVKRLLNANAREKVSMSMANMMIDAGGGRKEMMKIIENLRREGERRRSTSPFSLHKPSPPRID